MNKPFNPETGKFDMVDVLDPEVIAQMEPDEILVHIEELKQAYVDKKEAKFAEALSTINGIISKLEIDGVHDVFTLTEYMSTVKKETVKQDDKQKQKRTVTHQWVHRKNPDLKWTGRGQVIGWLRDEMSEAGLDPTDKNAVKAYCNEHLDYVEITPR